MRVNEIFYSLQGEGYYTGTPAVFIRFSGCNLKCGFCDTEHADFIEMTENEIVEKVSGFPASHVVITGGEPTLQLTPALVEQLHGIGKYVQIETNGTNVIPEEWGVDWITCSPKNAEVRLKRIDELKVVYVDKSQDMSRYDKFGARVLCLQPCDTKNVELNSAILKGAIDYCLHHPAWRLSLQTHKIIDVR